jgi:hypothetical protein
MTLSQITQEILCRVKAEGRIPQQCDYYQEKHSGKNTRWAKDMLDAIKMCRYNGYKESPLVYMKPLREFRKHLKTQL